MVTDLLKLRWSKDKKCRGGAGATAQRLRVLTALGVVVLLTYEDTCPYEVLTNSHRHTHNASNILPLQHGGGVGTGNPVILPGGVLMWSDWGIKGDGSVCSQLFSSVDRKDGRHSSECRRITHNAWRKSTLLGPTEAVCTQVVQKHVETFV